MANTYTQIHIQAVFSVQNRDCIIHKSWKDELYIKSDPNFSTQQILEKCVHAFPDNQLKKIASKEGWSREYNI